MPFAKSYSDEAGFSALAEKKAKYQLRLVPEKKTRKKASFNHLIIDTKI